MSVEKSIKLSPFWTGREEYLMNRLKQIISGDKFGPFKKDSGYEWQIDSSNNWWAEIRGGDELIIAYRHGETEWFKNIFKDLKNCFQ